MDENRLLYLLRNYSVHIISLESKDINLLRAEALILSRLCAIIGLKRMEAGYLRLKMAFIFGMFTLSIGCIVTGIKDINKILGLKASLGYVLIFFSFILPALILGKEKKNLIKWLLHLFI